MMGNDNLIENLNRALSLELGAVIQYTQHSFLVTGIEREVYRKYFRKQGEESSPPESSTRNSRTRSRRTCSKCTRVGRRAEN